MGNLNPLRYRGYYYDAELELYWLNTRFYDPNLGRFVNADGIVAGTSESVHGYNQYAYCFNNPINMQDSGGEWPSWLKKAVAVVATAVAVVAATAITVATCGAGSVAGVAMISATVTVAARATEVVALQVKKGRSEGKDASQIVKDSFEAVYDNGSKIIGTTPGTKLASVGFRHYVDASVEKIFDGQQKLTATLKSPTGKVVSSVFAGIEIANSVISILSNDPVERAEQRGYELK